jgi:hypothetical protein
MAARSPRRSFATPFVVTLAGSAALAACFVEPAPRATQPQPNTTPTQVEPPQPAPHVVANPPMPAPEPAPAAPPPAVIANPPRPQPVAKTDRHWTVTRAGDNCRASSNDACPPVPKGQPIPTCNPPPPMAYSCPDGSVNGESLTVVQHAGQSVCTIEAAPVTCPKGMSCNPPPPRKVACPQ